MGLKRADIIEVLKGDILRLEGFKSVGKTERKNGLGLLNDAFPNGTFPLGAVHEFLSIREEDYSATGGFVSSLLSGIMGSNGVAIWVSTSHEIYAPALNGFGLQPDRIIFVELHKERDVLWAMEEALKCRTLTAVIAEVGDISFTASRRLQLAVEESNVTGFLLRRGNGKVNTTACVSRWMISSQPSQPIDDLPGVGFPRWRVQLLKVKNGRPGTWNISWVNGKFKAEIISNPSSTDCDKPLTDYRKTA